jgi:hypothetical protein
MNQRRLLALAAALLLLVLGCVAVLAARQQPDDSRIFTVAQVRAGIRREPAAWIGRIIRVRALVTGIVLQVPMHRRGGAVSSISVLVALPGPYCPTASIGCGTAPTFLASSPISTVQLSDTAWPSTAPTLLAAVRSAPPWLALVRRIPGMGGLFAQPQSVSLIGVATYRLRLLSTSGCHQMCTDAVLLDAA